MRFLIESPTGEQYELSSTHYFLSEWAPKGFHVVEDPPTGYGVPEVDAPNPKEMTRAELNDYATRAGIEAPDAYQTKAALILAIEEHQRPQTEPVPTEEPPTEEPAPDADEGEGDA